MVQGPVAARQTQVAEGILWQAFRLEYKGNIYGKPYPQEDNQG